MNLSTLLIKLGLSPEWVQDVTLLLVVIFVSFLFGMFIGKRKPFTVLINIYISLALIYSAPADWLGSVGTKIIIFYVLVVGLTLLDRRLFEANISGAGSGFLWRVFVLSFLEVALLLSVTFSILPKKEALGWISSAAYGYLTEDPFRLIWMAAPLIFIFTMRKKLNR